MKSRLKSISEGVCRRGGRSFTLVEVMVSMAVLVVILLLMATMVNEVSRAYAQGRGRADNFTRARALLGMVAGDIQGGVFRSDLPAFSVGNSMSTNTNGGVSIMTNGGYMTNAFFTRRPGVGTDVRNLSLIVYTLGTTTNAILQRSYLSIPWTNSGDWSQLLPFQSDLGALMQNNPPTELDAAEGVVAFALLFHRADGSITNFYSGYQPTNAVVAVSVGMAVVDQSTLALLNQANKLSSLRDALTNSTYGFTGTNSMKADWSQKLNTAFYSQYPTSLSSGLKTFERCIPVEPPF